MCEMRWWSSDHEIKLRYDKMLEAKDKRIAELEKTLTISEKAFRVALRARQEMQAERDRLRKGLANALPELQFLVGHLEGRMGDAAHTQFSMLVDDLAALLREE